MALTKNLGTPTGPSKSVIDSGPLIDPGANTNAAINSIADSAFSLFTGVQNRKKRKEAEGKAGRAEQRAVRSQERAEVTFAQSQEDRADSQSNDIFQDDLAKSLRGLNKVQSGISQGALPNSSLQLKTEETVTALLQRHPGMEEELNKGFKAAGFDHLIFGALQDAEKSHVSARDNQLAREEAAIDVAFSTGLATELTPRHEAVSLGQTVTATQQEISNLKTRSDLINANRRLSLDEKEAELKANDRELVKTSSRASRELGGSVVSGLIHGIANSTPETFSELVKQVPSKVAQLEEQRLELYELSGDDPEAIKQIDKNINQYKELLTGISSGDYSAAKAATDSMNNLKTNLSLSMYQTAPALSFIQSLPKAMGDPILEQAGISFMGDAALSEGLADQLAGLVTENSQRFNTLMKNRDERPPVSQLKLGEARDVVKSDAYIQKNALMKVLQDPSDPVNRAEFLEAQTHLLPFFERTVSSTRDSLKDVEAGLNLVASPQVVQGLEASMKDPATKNLAEQLLFSTRKNVERSVKSLQTNSSVGKSSQDPFDVRYNPSLSQYEAVYDESFIDKSFPKIEGTPGLDSHVAAIKKNSLLRGPSDKVLDKVALLNRSMDFLVRTNQYDATMKDVSDKEFLDAFAANDFSKIFSAGAPSSLGSLDSSVNTLEEANTTEAALKGLALSSSYRVTEETIAPALDAAAKVNNVPPALLHAMADAETGHLKGDKRADVTNDWGARGVLQMTKPTAESLGYSWEDMKDLEMNAKASAEYISDQLENFNGDIEDALMAYNAGPTKVRRWIRQGRPIIEGRSWQSNAFPYVEKILSKLENNSIEETSKEQK